MHIHSNAPAGRRLPPNEEIVTDLACLALIALLSAAPYVTQLGFYSDDWTIVANFREGRFGAGAMLHDFPSRPVQGLYLALLFNLFELNPAGYHLVNLLVLALCAVAHYLLLVRLRFARAEAFAATAILLVLPQLSTVRVWVAAAQIPLSMLFALASMHAQLWFLQTRKAVAAAAAVVAALLSLAAYEIFAPFLLALPVAFALLPRAAADACGVQRAAVRDTLFAAGGAVVVAAGLKMLLSERARLRSDPQDYVEGLRTFFSPAYDWRTDYGPNLLAAWDVYVRELLRGWSNAAAALSSGSLSAPVIAVIAAAAAVTALRLHGVHGLRSARLALLGFAAFLLGHAVFLLLGGLMFSPAGMANRVSVAAAPGLALLMVALIAFVSSRASARLRPFLYSGGLALVVALGMARSGVVDSHWARAAEIQSEILEIARRDLAAVPAGSTVIIDGICPYLGPGVVFETWWDAGPALSLALSRKLRADVINERTKFSRTAVETSIYNEPTTYSYGEKLFVYNPSAHVLTRLADANAARAYLSGRRPHACPPSYVGHGVLI